MLSVPLDERCGPIVGSSGASAVVTQCASESNTRDLSSGGSIICILYDERDARDVPVVIAQRPNVPSARGRALRQRVPGQFFESISAKMSTPHRSLRAGNDELHPACLPLRFQRLDRRVRGEKANADVSGLGRRASWTNTLSLPSPPTKDPSRGGCTPRTAFGVLRGHTRGGRSRSQCARSPRRGQKRFLGHKGELVLSRFTFLKSKYTQWWHRSQATHGVWVVDLLGSIEFP